ncbi:MAG TPA: diacylglycerol kinase [Anaerolineae bacterium]|jgi:diacylglycerol kinase|nr:diacylglycerol kinase [Anaerolineae bacterium]HCK66456.1 diacylglycerol kinase [Anaerolineae bacterium]
MKSFLYSRIHAFRHAFRGLFYVMKTQRNAWIHTAVTVAVFLLGIWLRISLTEWAIIVLTIALVFMAEFINTAIEAVVDLASPNKHPLAKIGKDVGAAAVLVAAFAAVLVGLLILGPPLLEKLITVY